MAEEAKKKSKKCNCRNSKCLKLYCECFAQQIYCSDCNCTKCYNNPQHELAREESIKWAREKNPNAFNSKKHNRDETQKHSCSCRKSNCVKKYCECFERSQPCNEQCKCVECKNNIQQHMQNQGMNYNQSDSISQGQEDINSQTTKKTKKNEQGEIQKLALNNQCQNTQQRWSNLNHLCNKFFNQIKTKTLTDQSEEEIAMQIFKKASQNKKNKKQLAQKSDNTEFDQGQLECDEEFSDSESEEKTQEFLKMQEIIINTCYDFLKEYDQQIDTSSLYNLENSGFI